MRIGYDLQACQTDSRDRGIGRYSDNLVSTMIALASADHIDSVIALDGTDAGRLRDVRNRLRRQNVAAPTAVYTYPTTSFIDMDSARAKAGALLRGRFFENLNLDSLLVTSYFETGANYTTGLPWGDFQVPSAAIAYDLIPLIYPDRYLPEGHFISEWYPRKCKEFCRFDRFFAISEATRRDMVEYLSIAPERIDVIGAGLDPGLLAAARDPAWSSPDLLTQLDIREPFVLLVSNGDWRKNTLGALQAFARLPKSLRETHLFVLIQVGDDVKEALAGSLRVIAPRVRVLGKVSDQVLATLYRHCAVFFFPSLYEGFGLPVLEAMAFGAPVLSSNLGSLPEVIHNSDALFDPRDEEMTVALLKRALDDASYQQALRSGAAEHAQTFTWERCARPALKALKEMGGSRSSPANIGQLPSGQLHTQRSDVSILADFLGESTSPLDILDVQRSLRSMAAHGRRRILIDITEVVRLDARSGIQRVVRNVCKGMFNNAMVGCDVQPICWTENGIVHANKFARERLDLALPEVDAPLEVRANDLLLMLDSSWWMPERFDALHEQIWSAGGEVVWMVYDLIPILFPETCDTGMSDVFGKWLSHAVATVDGFLCISEATRHDLEQFIDDRQASYTRRPWTRTVPLGSDLDSGVAQPPTQTTLDMLDSFGSMPFFIAVGTIEPRKNYATILAAFDKLWADETNCALVIVGKQGWNVDVLAERLRKHPEAGKKLFWLNNTPDADLTYLMSRAHALIQASLAEGYGLPIVEAAAKGLPLILSDIAVFQEVAKGAAAYFAPRDSDYLANLIAGCKDREFGIPNAAILKPLPWREASKEMLSSLLHSPSK